MAKGVGFRIANQAKVAEGTMPSLTIQQIEQLPKSLPLASSNNSITVSHSKETDEEINYSFTGITICFHTEQKAINLVIDTGATDDMASLPHCLSSVKSNDINYCIKL